MKKMNEAAKNPRLYSTSRWKKWGFVFFAIHLILFLIAVVGSSVLGFIYREESPILFLLYSLPLYFDFPVSFLISSFMESMKVSISDLPFMIILFFAGSCYWFFVGSILGLIFRSRKK